MKRPILSVFFPVILILLVAVQIMPRALAEGSETLGPVDIPIASGTDIIAAGTGLVTQPGTINIDVPATATIQQVLLYWGGRSFIGDPFDDTISVVGLADDIQGTLLGSADIPGGFATAGFRADITDLGLITNGPNALTLQGLGFTHENSGAGVLVIVDDGSEASEITVFDGNDLGFLLPPSVPPDPPSPFSPTIAQIFDFPPVGGDRTSTLVLFVYDVRTSEAELPSDRPVSTLIRITVDGTVTELVNELYNADGEKWDTLTVPVTIPANASTVEVEVIPTDPGTSGLEFPSFVWMTAALSTPVSGAPPVECGECEGKVANLTLQYNGSIDNAQVQVLQKKGGAIVFDGIVQPGGTFSFAGVDKKATLGTEIIISVNGEQNARIHTSCSQPVGPGLVRGDFEVVEGTSRIGGLLCPVSVPDEPAECEGKVNKLTLQYNGAQADAFVEVIQKKGDVTVFAETLQPGEQFTFSGRDKKGTLGTEIIIYVNGEQNTRIHTSCSQPIGPGLVSGDFEVISGSSRRGGALSPI